MEINDLLTYLVSPVALVALIIGIAEVMKQSGFPVRWIPIVDVVLGLVFGVLVFTVYQNMQAIEGGIIGLALGLSASGTFSGIKSLSGK